MSLRHKKLIGPLKIIRLPSDRSPPQSYKYHTNIENSVKEAGLDKSDKALSQRQESKEFNFTNKAPFIISPGGEKARQKLNVPKNLLGIGIRTPSSYRHM